MGPDVRDHLLGEIGPLVHHGEEHALDLEPRVQGPADPLQGGAQRGDPLEGEVLALEGDEHALGGHEGVDGEQAQAGGAIDEDVVVAGGHRFQGLLQAELAGQQGNELDLRPREVAVGGSQGQVLEVGGDHDLLQRPLLDQHLVDAGPGLARLAAEPGGEVSLGVGVHGQHPPLGRGQAGRQVDGGGGLARDEGRLRLGGAAEDQHPAPLRHEHPQFPEGQGQPPQAEGLHRWAGVGVVAEAQDLDVGPPRGAGRLLEEGPAAGPGLQERHRKLRAQEGEDEAGGAVARTDIQEAPGDEKGEEGQNRGHQEPHPLRRTARPRQVHPGAPDGQEAEVRLERREGGRGETEGAERRAVLGYGSPPGVPGAAPAGATVTRRSPPSPTL